MKPTVNRHGTPLSPDGFVLCGICQQEVRRISKDTAPEYARCRTHGDWAGSAEKREEKKQEFMEWKKQQKEADNG